ncbi:C-C chemokine receptor type 6-like [Triplophysa dalaica]|uniref:C-C chemokine receptor type 6-like n=1 Tax=Triplophysa dalaica TaxID=1582913 RepID=UPI0024E02BCF|nr:C-C chemokine receptor type 6-like [Triplophysa dalaica]XP_056624029.1 C-C chemokine receptor type 6-like [Triplophysa dalaica]
MSNSTHNYSVEDDDYEEPCELRGSFENEVVIQTYIYSVICVLGLMGNLLVLITYALYKKAKTMTDIYLVNVALADLLFVVALPLIIYNERYNWDMGTWACKLLNGAYSINLYSSTLLLACISSDRYIAIVQARRSVKIRRRVQVYSRLICTVIWLLALVLSLPTLIYYEQVEDMDVNECMLVYHSNNNAKVMKILIPSTQMLMGFLVPLMVMMFCYSCIMVTLLKARNFQKHKAVRVVLTVVFVFIFCHLPYNVVLLLHTTKLFQIRDCKGERDTLMMLSISKSVAYLHCCLNPILYAFIGVKFRGHFYQILKNVSCLGHRYIYSRRNSQQTSDLYISAKSVVGSSYENPSSFTM